MNLEKRIKQLKLENERLEKKLLKIKAEMGDSNSDLIEISTIEDAYNLLKPIWYITFNGEISHQKFDNRCNMTTEKRARQIKSLIQLHLIAEAMNKNTNIEGVHFFYHVSADLQVLPISKLNKFFPLFFNQDLAKEALEKFKHLFKDLYMLD
jgi:hypothetical protein